MQPPFLPLRLFLLLSSMILLGLCLLDLRLGGALLPLHLTLSLHDALPISVAKEIGGKLSGAGEGEPHPASGRVDKGLEVSSTIEEERGEGEETEVAS